MTLIKYSCHILKTVYHTINLHTLFLYFINNYIIFPNHIFIICSKTDTLGEICSYFRKHLKILKSVTTSGLIRNVSILYSPTSSFNSSILIQPFPSLTASSASCNFTSSFFPLVRAHNLLYQALQNALYHFLS